MNLRKYIRQLILEQQEYAAFHGLGLNPEIMARDPRMKGCTTIWEDNDDEEGCPSFPGKGPISSKEIKVGVNFLNDIRPKTLMVYSRGASVLGHCLSDPGLQHIPDEVIFIAPAWKRWGTVDRSVFDKIKNKKIMHGELDAKVPLAHSFELANGAPVGVLLKGDHYSGKDFLKGKLAGVGEQLKKKYPNLFSEKGRVKGALKNMSWKQEAPDEIITSDGSGLPDWGLTGYGNFEQMVQQIEWIRKIIGQPLSESYSRYSILHVLYS